jgi:hypothetical protein
MRLMTAHFHPDDDEEERRCYWDEYDAYLPTIAAHLQRGDVDGLSAYLGLVRTAQIGLGLRSDMDRSAAQILTEWYGRLDVGDSGA